MVVAPPFTVVVDPELPDDLTGLLDMMYEPGEWWWQVGVWCWGGWLFSAFSRGYQVRGRIGESSVHLHGHLYKWLTPKRSRLNNQYVHSHEAQSLGEK